MTGGPASGSSNGASPEVAKGLADVVDALGGRHRAGQEQMAVAVGAAMHSGRHLLVQAGTGTGKSVAYLVPAAMHALSADARIVVSTATLALQRQLMQRDVPSVQSALRDRLSRPVVAAVLKGRANYLCRFRLEHGAADDSTMLPGTAGSLEQQAADVRAWAELTATGDRDEIAFDVDARVWRALSVSGRECLGRTRCPFGDECFAEIARDRAHEADIVVTNHALLAIDLQGDVAALPEFDVVVLDEAHEFVDRVVAAQTQRLGVRQVEGLAGLVRSHVPDDVVEGLRQASAAFGAALEGIAADIGPRRRLTTLRQDLILALSVLRDRCHEATTALAGAGAEPDAGRQRARAEVEEVHDLAGRLLANDANDVVWLAGDDGGQQPGLTVAPLTVQPQVRAGLLERATVIATSATLTVGGGFAHVAGALGLGPAGEASWDGLDVGSPFRYRDQGILYVARDLARPGRDGIAPATLDRIVDLVTAAGGRTLVLLSSWRSVDAVGERLVAAQSVTARLGTILVQERGVPAGLLVERFRSEPSSTLVGTMSLWQGVDVPGDTCVCVIVEKIPFPRPDDPIVAARQQELDDHGASGFFGVSVPAAALLLAQGVGRLIRTEDDRGVVAILDPRFAGSSYSTYLRSSLPDFWTTTDTAVAISALRRLSGQPE